MGSRSSSGSATGKRAAATPARTKASPKTEAEKKPATKAEVQPKANSSAVPRTRAATKTEPQPAVRAEAKSPATAKEPESHSKTSAPIAAETAVRKHTTPRLIKLPPEERYHLVRETAYYIAERRGFRGGSAEDDWAAAEKEVDRILKAKAKAER